MCQKQCRCEFLGTLQCDSIWTDFNYKIVYTSQCISVSIALIESDDLQYHFHPLGKSLCIMFNFILIRNVRLFSVVKEKILTKGKRTPIYIV